MPPARPPHWAVFLDLLLGFFLFFSSAFKLHPILLFPLGGSSRSVVHTLSPTSLLLFLLKDQSRLQLRVLPPGRAGRVGHPCLGGR